jgi:hypothetical protein
VTVADPVAGIAAQLVPFTLVDEPAHDTALAVARWQHGLYTATGQAGYAAQVIALLEVRR